MNTETAIITRKTVEELVREWNLATHLLKSGLDSLKEAEEHFRAFDGPCSHYDLCLFKHDEHTMEFDRKIKRLKSAAWRYLIDRMELKKLASVKRADEIDKQVAKGDDLPDITVENLFGWFDSLGTQAHQFLKEAVVEVFEFLRPPSLRFKTNSGFKIGKRVVLSNWVERQWSGGKFRCNYYYENQFRALDNVFHMLDGKGLSVYRNGDLANAILEAPGGVGETDFFKFRCYKNHNFHLEFKRPDLVRKLNEIGGNGLPMPGRDTP